MIGTIVNTVTIITGSIAGALLKKGIKPQYSDALFTAMGLAATGLGINAVVQNMPKSVYPVLFIVSLAFGCLIGTVIDIDKRFQALTLRLQRPKRSAAGVVALLMLSELLTGVMRQVSALWIWFLPLRKIVWARGFRRAYCFIA